MMSSPCSPRPLALLRSQVTKLRIPLMGSSSVFEGILISICLSIAYASAIQLPLAHQADTSDRLGAVASENKQCSQIGIDILTAGGNAADALVAIVFCVGVLDCHHSGIGGGGFALARSSNGSYESIDFRETAPAAAYENMFEHNFLESLFGGLASATPGEIRGLEYIHENHGRLPWSTLLQPAIHLARDGFVVSEDFAKAMDLSTRTNDFLSKDETWAIDFAPNGTRVGQGDRMTRKRYASTLQEIADHGADAFYKGPIAEALIQRVQETNGTMTTQDLETYTVGSRQPVSINYRGAYQLYACGAPSSGSVGLSVLKVVEGYDADDSDANLQVHRIDEAIRFGYGKRASFGDPDYVNDLYKFEQEMLSESFARDTRAKISDQHTLNVSAYDPGGFESHEDHGTSHIVTADASGMAFSLTSTVNLFFGSRVMVPETGVILNNQMNDFSIPNISNVFGYYPSPANYVKPAKRPLSSIAPMMAEFENGTLYTVLGASGGSRIITTTVLNAIHILDHNMSIKQALASPRFHDQLIPNHVTFETTYDNNTVASMKARGHKVTWGSAGSSAQALRIVNGNFEAGSEPRQKDSAGLTA